MTSRCSHVPATTMLYPLTNSLDKQVAGISGSQMWTDGQHQNHCIATLPPMARLMEMMINHTTFLTQPSEMRSKVTANDVLLHTAARMRKKPEVCETRLLDTCWLCVSSASSIPLPTRTSADSSTQPTNRQTCPVRTMLALRLAFPPEKLSRMGM